MLLTNFIQALLNGSRTFIVLLFVLPTFVYLLLTLITYLTTDRRPDFSLSNLSKLKLVLKEGWVFDKIRGNIILQLAHTNELFPAGNKLFQKLSYGQQIIVVEIHSSDGKDSFVVAVYNKNFKEISFDLDIAMVSRIVGKPSTEYRFQKCAEYLRGQVSEAVGLVLLNPQTDNKALSYVA